MITIIFYLLFLVFGAIIGASIAWYIFQQHIEPLQEYNQKIAKSNCELAKDNESLINLKNQAIQQLNTLREQIKEKEQFLSEVENHIKTTTNNLYETSYQLAQEKFSQAAEKLSQEYQNNQQILEENYLQLNKEAAEEHQALIANLQIKIKELEKTISKEEQILQENQNKVKASVEAAKRQAELEQQQTFYHINLTESDKKEIAKIKEIIPYLNDPEPLNKVIWKVYYEKPTSDLIGRVIGEGIKSGIYKITDTTSGKCYVGQSVNLSERWRQHIKRGLGAETPTKNKLYPAMKEIGIENFSFEIIEECPKEKLDELEDYWQNYFEAKSWGYSIK